MKSQKKSEERGLGYITTACYAFSLVLCGVGAYAFVAFALAAFNNAEYTLYYTGMRF